MTLICKQPPRQEGYTFTLFYARFSVLCFSLKSEKFNKLMEESDSFDGFDVNAWLVTSTCIGCSFVLMFM